MSLWPSSGSSISFFRHRWSHYHLLAQPVLCPEIAGLATHSSPRIPACTGAGGLGLRNFRWGCNFLLHLEVELWPSGSPIVTFTELLCLSFSPYFCLFCQVHAYTHNICVCVHIYISVFIKNILDLYVLLMCHRIPLKLKIKPNCMWKQLFVCVCVCVCVCT